MYIVYHVYFHVCVRVRGSIFHVINVWLNNTRVTDCLRSAVCFSIFFFIISLFEEKSTKIFTVVERKGERKIAISERLEKYSNRNGFFSSSRGHDEHDSLLILFLPN